MSREDFVLDPVCSARDTFPGRFAFCALVKWISMCVHAGNKIEDVGQGPRPIRRKF